MHQSGSQTEVLTKCVLHIKTGQRFAHHIVNALVFAGGVDGSSRRQEIFVNNAYCSRVVVYYIIDIFVQQDSTCRYFDRTRADVHSPQRNVCSPLGRLVFPLDTEFVFFGQLLNYGQTRVVEFLKNIFFGQDFIAYGFA